MSQGCRVCLAVLPSQPLSPVVFPVSEVQSVHLQLMECSKLKSSLGWIPRANITYIARSSNEVSPDSEHHNEHRVPTDQLGPAQLRQQDSASKSCNQSTLKPLSGKPHAWLGVLSLPPSWSPWVSKIQNPPPTFHKPPSPPKAQ
ncbi:uncharacterized protein IWZ02DRAFT_435015 [Phyllosticta citriasiana]|uniref:uncharacterized protein n=1 Tax=Phyllosticta citriasiana TaxID=595635 RepID=UPI0030FDB366